MTQQNIQYARANSIDKLPLLPDEITTRDGQVLEASGYVWRPTLSADLPTRVTIDWGQLLAVTAQETSRPVISERAVRLLMVFTAWMLSKNGSKWPVKPTSAKNYREAALSLARWLAAHPEWLPEGRGFEWSDMTEDLFDAWLTSEYGTSRRGQFPVLVRRFYRWGVKECAPDFSAALSSVLDALIMKGNVVGEKAAARDSKSGPFTSEEMDLIYSACAFGKGTDQDRAITWTFLEAAIRPEQMYRLRNRDLIDVESGGYAGTRDIRHRYWLRVQLLKQRGGEPRYAYLPLTQGCFQLLWDLRRTADDVDSRLFWWLRDDYVSHVNKRLKAFFVTADIRSPRLPAVNPSPGEPLFGLMPVNPTRFRYGAASERIAAGEPEGDVSYALTHTNAGSLHIYVATSPRIAEDFRRATDHAILPLVCRMEGRYDGRAEVTQPRRTPHAKPPAPREGVAFEGDTDGKYAPRRVEERTELLVDEDRVWDRIAEMVASARRRFSGRYPGQRFEAQVWDARHRAERPSAAGHKSLGFTTLESTGHEISRDLRDAMPAFFANVVKSWIILDGRVSAAGDLLRLNAARHLWGYVAGRVGAGEFFRWSSLSEDDFLAFECHLSAYRSTVGGRPLDADTILRIVAHAQRLVYFLAGRGVCRTFDYIPYTTSQRAISTQTLDGKKLAAARKLPAPGVPEALADIYRRLITVPAGEVSDYTLVLISAVAVLMFTGMRLGELLTLPFDCEVEEGVPAREPGGADVRRYGLRYWVEKTRKKTRRVKWISPTAEPVVREAVRRIKALTAEARRRAKVLEEHPTEVPLPPDVAGLDTLTRDQLISLLGYRDGSHLSSTSRGYIPSRTVGGRVSYRVEDVKAFLLSKRVRELYTYRCEGTVQMLSESLFVVFHNQSNWQTGKCDLLARPLNAKDISRFLSPKMRPTGLSLTVFSEFGLTEEERSLATNPHAFRHWLIHTAYRGGLTESLVLRYFEKRSGSDIADYIHFLPDDTGL